MKYKSLSYAYPTSDHARQYKCYRTGCWMIDTWDNSPDADGLFEPSDKVAFACGREAFQHWITTPGRIHPMSFFGARDYLTIRERRMTMTPWLHAPFIPENKGA